MFGAILPGFVFGISVYLDYGTNSDNIMLDINTLMMLGQMWDIGVTYIKCNSPERVSRDAGTYGLELQGNN